MDIKNKVVVLTGASQGIGLATARYLATKEAKLVLAARSKDALEYLAQELPDAIAVVTDMRKAQDVKNLIQKAVKKYGRIDILINNAGQGMYGPIETADIDQYRAVMELNVFSVLRAMQETIPIMRKQGGGLILNISSMVSKNYFPYLGMYASTKYALNAISLTARQELLSDHIVVSVFHPRMTATNFGENALGARPDFSAPAQKGRPVPQIDSAEEVARKIGELIRSEEAEMFMQ